MLVTATTIGVVGFILIENYTFIEAFYMTIITMTTVGFLEVHPLSDAGRIFTSFLSVVNIGIFFYGVTAIVGFIIEGEFRNFFKIYSMRKKI
jgi:voltage-gated potassium channel